MEISKLHVHNVDLHYHAGQERHHETTLEDYVEHARLSGRRVLGLTDHLGRYLGGNASAGRNDLHYPASLAGLEEYRRDVDRMQPLYPELLLLFAPEVPPATALSEVPDTVTALADFFIIEAAFPSPSSPEQNTEALVARLRETREFTDRTGRPAFIAHPMRAAVNLRLIKHQVQPWVTEMPPRPGGEFTPGELKEFFLLDFERIGRAAAELGVPLELNGNTQYRVRSSNLPAPLQMLWSALGVLNSLGCELLPGSDQHGFRAGVGRIGMYVAADCFHALGITIRDMPFLEDLLEGTSAEDSVSTQAGARSRKGGP